MSDELNTKTARDGTRTSPCSGSVFDQCVNMDYSKIFDRIMEPQSATCDDREGVLTVTVALDGDLHLWVKSTPQTTMKFSPSFRARTVGGGGRNQRIRDALMLLALAINEDVEQNV